jgi:hypothetical protein
LKLASARSHVADLAALAREGCRRSKDRVLSRAERGRQTRAAEHSLYLLLNDSICRGCAAPVRQHAELDDSSS